MRRGQRGIADLPGFRESLELLLLEERYAETDVAMMFGVSRERIRQLVRQLQIQKAPRRGGLNDVRVWDDVANRFRPIGRKVVRQQRERAQGVVYREQLTREREQRRARMVAITRALAAALGRDPSHREIASALSGRLASQSGSGPTIAAHWGLDRGRSGSYRQAMEEFRAAAGIRVRKRGEHVVQRQRRTA